MVCAARTAVNPTDGCYSAERRAQSVMLILPLHARMRATLDEFQKCLMEVGADATYADWLRGRNAGERDRSPCWHRLKAIIVRRLTAERGTPQVWLQPEWASH